MLFRIIHFTDLTAFEVYLENQAVRARRSFIAHVSGSHLFFEVTTAERWIREWGALALLTVLAIVEVSKRLSLFQQVLHLIKGYFGCGRE